MPSMTITISASDLSRILEATGYVSGNQESHIKTVLRKHIVALVRAFELEQAVDTFAGTHVPPDLT